MKKNVKKEKAPEGIVINQIVIRNIDRSQKDIADWRLAHRAAEAVVHPIRTRLYDLYSDVILDGHLTGIMQKRIDAVLNKNIHFEKQGTDGKKAERVEELDDLIESEMFRKVIAKAIESKFYGISGMEFIPGTDFYFEEVPRKHIKPEIKIIATEQSEETGIAYEGLSNVWVIGEKNDYGLLLKCAPYAIWKRGNMADWAQYIEIFGQPVRVIKYDAFDLKTKMELQTVLDESGSSLALMIPKQADFEMLDGKATNADGKLQDTFKTACNDEMSVIILTNTETTTSSSSSGYAQSKEHGKQQLEITKSDIKFVNNLLNSKQFIGILQSYGYPVEEGRFVYEKEIDLAEMLNRVTIDTFVSGKVPVGDDYYYETYGIPKPDDYDALKAKMEEEKMMKLNPPQPGMPPQKTKVKTKKDKPKNLADNTGFKDWFKETFPLFFASAHKE